MVLARQAAEKYLFPWGSRREVDAPSAPVRRAVVVQPGAKKKRVRAKVRSAHQRGARARSAKVRVTRDDACCCCFCFLLSFALRRRCARRGAKRQYYLFYPLIAALEDTMIYAERHAIIYRDTTKRRPRWRARARAARDDDMLILMR